MRVILRLPEQPAGQPGEQGQPRPGGRAVVCDVTACQGPAGLLTLVPREPFEVAAGEPMALELNMADVR